MVAEMTFSTVLPKAQDSHPSRLGWWHGVLAIWGRHIMVWKAHFWPSVVSNILNPLLFLFAFGFGLGAVIDKIDGLPYLVYVLPGIAANAAFFNASFESSVVAFGRFHTQKTYNAILATPVGLTEILAAEAFWSATKSLLAAASVLGVGFAIGGIGSSWGALVALPLVFLCSIAFACFGLFMMSLARGFEFFNYFFTFWVTPSFLFAGVFFGVDRFPGWVQPIAWALPMTHMVAILRPIIAGSPLDLTMAAGHLAYVTLFGMVFYLLAWRQLRRRLFD